MRQTEMWVETAAPLATHPHRPLAPPEQARVAELLDTLVSLGQARRLADGRFIA